MRSSDGSLEQVEAEVATSFATVRLVWFDLREPPDQITQWDRYRLDLCMTPRPLNMRASYGNHWEAHRFVRVGDMFLVPPGEPIHIKADSPVLQTSIICEIDPTLLHEWIGFELDWTSRRLESTLDISSNTIRHLLRRLAEETRAPRFGSAKFLEFVAGQLAIEIGRHFEGVMDTPVSGGLASWRLRIIDERLGEPGKPPTLVEMAELCSLSVRQLTRGFRTSRGCSIGEYVAQTRIDNAKRLLASGHGVKAIAHSLGFSSVASFSRVFRLVAGLTPRQFLHRVLRGKE